jgi:hypothetical protein
MLMQKKTAKLEARGQDVKKLLQQTQGTITIDEMNYSGNKKLA